MKDSSLSPLSLQPHPLSSAFRYLNLYSDTEDDRVLVVALSRPRKRNAINARLWKELGLVFGREIGRTPSLHRIRSVLLVGEGRAFCAGIDVTDVSFFPKTTAVVRLLGPKDQSNHDKSDTDVAHVGLQFVPLLRDLQACLAALERCPVPVVAALHGSCIGAGIDLVTAADVRLAAADTTFSVREVALGLAADVGTLQRLPKICGNQAWVRDVCLTGRNFDAAEASRYGLVVHEPYATRDDVWRAGMALCRTMAQHSPVAVRGTKQALLYSRDHSVADSLEQIAAYNMLALQSPQMMTGMQSQLTGERPVYADVPPESRL